MKSFQFLLILVFLSKSVFGQTDSGFVTQNGWLLYWKDAVFWFPAKIDKNVKDEKFFESGEVYKNGLFLNYLSQTGYYKAISTKYEVHIKDDKNSFRDSIWILPVKISAKLGFEADPDVTILYFTKNGIPVSVEFRGNADYDIRELKLLRKSDKRKLRRFERNRTF